MIRQPQLQPLQQHVAFKQVGPIGARVQRHIAEGTRNPVYSQRRQNRLNMGLPHCNTSRVSKLVYLGVVCGEEKVFSAIATLVTRHPVFTSSRPPGARLSAGAVPTLRQETCRLSSALLHVRHSAAPYHQPQLVGRDNASSLVCHPTSG